MTGVGRNRWGYVLELFGATALAGACAFAVTQIMIARGFAASAFEAAIFAAAISFWIAYRTLCAIASANERLPLMKFILTPFPTEGGGEAEELLLENVYRSPPPAQRILGEGELVLDDILVQLAPDARVVRLFDVTKLPTPGQLRARIERHLITSRPTSSPPDASEALYQALAELRRTLR